MTAFSQDQLKTPAASAQRPAASGPGFKDRSIEEVAQLEQRDKLDRSLVNHVADFVAGIAGSMPFALANAVFFAAWIVINARWTPIEAFDPYPFGGLTVAVSLEAIFLAIFVLMSQNRQSLHADRRAKVDLQINAIAEREVTKLILLVEELHDYLGTDRERDEELNEMKEPIPVGQLADAVDGHEPLSSASRSSTDLTDTGA